MFWSFFWKPAFQLVDSHPVLSQEVISSRVQDFTFAFVVLWGSCPDVDLNRSPAPQYIDHSSQHRIVHSLSENAFYPVIQVVHEDVKQYCPQLSPLVGPPLVTVSHLHFVLTIITLRAQQSSQFSTHHIIHLSGQNLSDNALVSKKWVNCHVCYFKPCRANSVIPKLDVDKHNLNVFNSVMSLHILKLLQDKVHQILSHNFNVVM